MPEFVHFVTVHVVPAATLHDDRRRLPKRIAAFEDDRAIVGDDSTGQGEGEGKGANRVQRESRV